MAQHATTHLTPQRVVPTLVKLFEQASGISHWRRAEVFDDFLHVAVITLEHEPAHLDSLRTHGRPLRIEEETPEAQTTWRTLQQRYEAHWPTIYAAFCDAFAVLKQAALLDWHDWLGQTYMALEIGNPHKGQYFTPWEVARLMADVTYSPDRIHDRVKAALMHPDNVHGVAMLLAGTLITDAAKAEEWFLQNVLPAALPYIEPVTVHDPACGSGVMLLAIASGVPWWANLAGIVQYSGQDIDQTCVLMARAQLMLYGLNGHRARCMLAMQPESPSEAASDQVEPPALQPVGTDVKIAQLSLF
ncbi:MAG TPA: N-6 DNA methylase, partial [Roseiflexaceae bacterium]|nr:N-6 DNA methylase [Roseiflexaceae bacterium]